MIKVGRNAPCPCGSGLKYKRCCEQKDRVAAAERILPTLDAGEQAEIRLFEHVYQGILQGVWNTFHPSGGMPDVEVMEEFYREIYGHDLDGELVDEMLFPLSRKAEAQIIAVNKITVEKIIDVTPEDSSPGGP